MRTAFLIAAICVAASLAAQEPAPFRPLVVGRWDLTLTASDGRKLPSWLEVQVSGNHVLVGRFVAVVGSARPISRLDFSHDTLRFAIPSQWEGGSDDLRFEAVLASDNLTGAVTMPDGRQLPLTGVRARERKRPDGSATSEMPSPVISKQPTSSVGPKRFLWARTNRRACA